MNSQLTDLLKLLCTAAVTVMGSYMAITAHIDATVASKVQEVTASVTASVDAVEVRLDSLEARDERKWNAMREWANSGRRGKVTF